MFTQKTPSWPIDEWRGLVITMQQIAASDCIALNVLYSSNQFIEFSGLSRKLSGKISFQRPSFEDEINWRRFWSIIPRFWKEKSGGKCWWSMSWNIWTIRNFRKPFLLYSWFRFLSNHSNKCLLFLYVIILAQSSRSTSHLPQTAVFCILARLASNL